MSYFSILIYTSCISLLTDLKSKLLYLYAQKEKVQPLKSSFFWRFYKTAILNLLSSLLAWRTGVIKTWTAQVTDHVEPTTPRAQAVWRFTVQPVGLSPPPVVFCTGGLTDYMSGMSFMLTVTLISQKEPRLPAAVNLALDRPCGVCCATDPLQGWGQSADCRAAYCSVWFNTALPGLFH